MIKGTFRPNEVVVGRMPGVKYKNHPKNTQPRLRALICVPNRRWGRRQGLRPGESAFRKDPKFAEGKEESLHQLSEIHIIPTKLYHQHIQLQ